MKRWLAVISLALVVLLTLARCFGGRRDPEDLVDEVLEESREELERLAQVARDLKIYEPVSVETVYGGTVRIGGLVLTLEKPHRERRLWAAFMTLENVGEVSAYPDPAMFIAVDDVGDQYEASWHILVSMHRFEWRELLPGETRRGNVVFELREGRVPVAVVYEAGLEPFEVMWRGA